VLPALGPVFVIAIGPCGTFAAAAMGGLFACSEQGDGSAQGDGSSVLIGFLTVARGKEGLPCVI
jgi:hypothetical protein